MYIYLSIYLSYYLSPNPSISIYMQRIHVWSCFVFQVSEKCKTNYDAHAPFYCTVILYSDLISVQYYSHLCLCYSIMQTVTIALYSIKSLLIAIIFIMEFTAKFNFLLYNIIWL